MSTRNVLKGWFSSRAKPTQSQFGLWIDSFFHLTEDTLPIAKVDGLQTTLDALTLNINQTTTAVSGIVLTAGTAVFVCVANKVYDKVVFIDATINGTTINIGETPGGTEINSVTVANGRAALVQEISYGVNTTIYFSNISAATVTKIRTSI